MCKTLTSGTLLSSKIASNEFLKRLNVVHSIQTAPFCQMNGSVSKRPSRLSWRLKHALLAQSQDASPEGGATLAGPPLSESSPAAGRAWQSCAGGAPGGQQAVQQESGRMADAPPGQGASSSLHSNTSSSFVVFSLQPVASRPTREVRRHLKYGQFGTSQCALGTLASALGPRVTVTGRRKPQQPAGQRNPATVVAWPEPHQRGGEVGSRAQRDPCGCAHCSAAATATSHGKQKPSPPEVSERTFPAHPGGTLGTPQAPDPGKAPCVQGFSKC